MAQQFTALAALEEDQGIIPSTRTAHTIVFNTNSKGIPHPLLASAGMACVWCTHMQATFTHIK